MAKGEVELTRLNLSQAKLAALPSQHRYVFALAGHVFNELMALQKLVIATHPADDAHVFVRDAAFGSALFVLRMLVGKTEEAMKVLRKESVDSILRSEFFSKADGALDQWEAAKVKYVAMPWLNKIRNSRSFHYMNSAQWEPSLAASIVEDPYIIVAKTHGNTFFYWNEIAAAWPMLELVNEAAPLEGLGAMLSELNDLLRDICGALAVGLQAFLYAAATEKDALDNPSSVIVPTVSSASLPYFLAKD